MQLAALSKARRSIDGGWQGGGVGAADEGERARKGAGQEKGMEAAADGGGG